MVVLSIIIGYVHQFISHCLIALDPCVFLHKTCNWLFRIHSGYFPIFQNIAPIQTRLKIMWCKSCFATRRKELNHVYLSCNVCNKRQINAFLTIFLWFPKPSERVCSYLFILPLVLIQFSQERWIDNFIKTWVIL